MGEKEQILQAIYEAIDEWNQEQRSDRKLAKSPDTQLYGRDALLDSLGLVTLVVGTEYRVEERFGQTVTLTNEKAFSQKNSPFRSVGCLADYIATLLNEKGV
jgi:D-alanine--poly(phosphoribitol) ligase subunit 2